jgi:hypothetical protein
MTAALQVERNAHRARLPEKVRLCAPIGVRVTEHIRAQIDGFAEREGVTRSHAVRSLLAAGLASLDGSGATVLSPRTIHFVQPRTELLSILLRPGDVFLIDQLAKKSGVKRSRVVRWLIRIGLAERSQE